MKALMYSGSRWKISYAEPLDQIKTTQIIFEKLFPVHIGWLCSVKVIFYGSFQCQTSNKVAWIYTPSFTKQNWCLTSVTRPALYDRAVPFNSSDPGALSLVRCEKHHVNGRSLLSPAGAEY